MLSVPAAPRTNRCACCGKPVSSYQFFDDNLPFLRVSLTGRAEYIHPSCARGLGYRKQLMTVLVAPETTDKISWWRRLIKFLGR